MNAIQLLKRDHRAVTKLFQRFSAGGSERTAVAEKICGELEVHTAIEEEIFYPAVREAGDPELERQVDEALEEHRRAKATIQTIGTSLEDADGEGSELDAQMAALQQDIEHHVEEEEGEMFPRVEEMMDARLDDLGARLEKRKTELTSAESGSRTRTGTRSAGRERSRSSGEGRASTTRARGRNTGGRSRSSEGRSLQTPSRGRASTGGRSRSSTSGTTGAKAGARSRTKTKRRNARRQGPRRQTARARTKSSTRKRARGSR